MQGDLKQDRKEIWNIKRKAPGKVNRTRSFDFFVKEQDKVTRSQIFAKTMWTREDKSFNFPWFGKADNGGDALRIESEFLNQMT